MGTCTSDTRRGAWVVDLAGHRDEVDLAVFVVVHEYELAPGALLELQERDGVGRVLRPHGDDPVACHEGQGEHRRLPPPGGGVGEGDLAGRRTQQASDRRVHRFGAGRLPAGCLVATDLRFEAQVIDDGVEHRLRVERRAGVVEMEDVLAARGEGPSPVDIERSHGRSVPI